MLKCLQVGESVVIMWCQVTKTDVASMLNRLCEISHADKATAMSALRSAMEGRSDGIGAAMNRAAELLLPSKSSQAHH